MIRNLTGLRFFVAIWVVFYHVKEAVAISFISDVVNIGYLGVDVFFILSGYILTHVYFREFFLSRPTYYMYRDFIKKRFARIYPLHIVSLIAAIAFLIILNTITNANYVMYWNHIVPQVLLVHAWGVVESIRWNFPSWSVSAEWFAYLLMFPLSAFIFRKFNLSGMIVIVGAFFIVWIGLTVQYFENDIGLQLEAGIMRIIPEFLLGSLTYIVFKTCRRQMDVALITGSFILLLLVSIFIAKNLQFVIVLLIPFILIMLHRGNTIADFIFGSPIIVFLGEISYSIYMLHFFSRAFNGIIAVNLFDERVSGWYFINYFFLTVMFAIAGYYLIELPARKWINKFSLKV